MAKSLLPHTAKITFVTSPNRERSGNCLSRVAILAKNSPKYPALRMEDILDWHVQMRTDIGKRVEFREKQDVSELHPALTREAYETFIMAKAHKVNHFFIDGYPCDELHEHALYDLPLSYLVHLEEPGPSKVRLAANAFLEMHRGEIVPVNASIEREVTAVIEGSHLDDSVSDKWLRLLPKKVETKRSPKLRRPNGNLNLTDLARHSLFLEGHGAA